MLEKSKYDKYKNILQDLELPPGLDVLLAHTISQRFRKAGIYFHLFRRYKTIDSILHKLDCVKPGAREYSDTHKIQDLIGLKYVFYFVDDLEKAKEIIEKVGEETKAYKLVKWAETKETANEFSATKINGVFRIPPAKFPQETRTSMAECKIDTTFEIQLKTMLFQSWHETDHDLRYKNRELWKLMPEMDRKLNRILATLELSDSSVNNVFDKLTAKAFSLVEEHYNDEPINPVLLERIAQVHFRIRMEDSFPMKRGKGNITEPSPKGKRKDKKAFDIDEMNKIFDPEKCRDYMVAHFTKAFETMAKTGEEKDAYREKAEDITKVFMSIDFLKTLTDYKRSKLIDGFLNYENDIPINIFNICALIYTEPMIKSSLPTQADEKKEEWVPLLKRYLRKQHHPHNRNQNSEQKAEKTKENGQKIEKTKDNGAQTTTYKNKNTYIRKNKEYATYQCYCDVFPADTNLTTQDCFKKILSKALTWLNSRINYNEENKEDKENKPLTQLIKLAEDMKDPNFALTSQLIRVTKSYDLRFVYVESQKNCAIRITEPDKKYENNYGEDEINAFMENRTFITDIGIREVEDHVELGVRCSCKEPVSNSIEASAFRPAFVRIILDDTKDFCVTEHGIDKAFRWDHKNQKVYEITQPDDLKNLIIAKSRQLPLVVLPPNALNDPDFESESLARSLAGYGHVTVDMNDEGDDVKIYPPGKRKTLIIEPDWFDDNPSYVYTRQRIYERIVQSTVNKNLRFGEVKFYPDLKGKYYEELDPYGIKELNQRIKTLERQLKQLQKTKQK